MILLYIKGHGQDFDQNLFSFLEILKMLQLNIFNFQLRFERQSSSYQWDTKLIILCYANKAQIIFFYILNFPGYVLIFG